MTVLDDIFPKPKPIIGMIHLRPLPGSPLYDPGKLNMAELIDIAVDEAQLLQQGGVDGLQVENIWDFPYVKGEQIGHETTAAMAAAALKVKEAVDLPIGINLHLNGGLAAMAAAVAAGARWIRVFEWVNAYVSHTGITEGIGGQLARYRHALRADEIKFFCDVNVKHGSHFIIADRSITEQAHDAESEGADALIVTGFETGQAPTPERVKEFTQNVRIPVIVGSGTTVENVADLLKHADGAIVGSTFKVDGNWKNSVSLERTRAFMSAVESIRNG
ncbi:MAG: BtpA/SgcQ family protein [Anaerolineales bacterium]|nr:BtpA/SgcQ family protein [Anaerolineales bacterium]